MRADHSSRRGRPKTAYIRTALAVVRIANRAARDRAALESVLPPRARVLPARLRIVHER